MNNNDLDNQISDEIMAMINQRNSLMLASLTIEGEPYASYAPYAVGEDCLYVLISDIAVHARNLQQHPRASVLIIEDEDSANELFARLRVQYSVSAELIARDSAQWHSGISCLTKRHGKRITSLSQMSDFKLFCLHPLGGRYVKGFGQAFQIDGGSLAGKQLSHLRDGHKSAN